MIGFNILKHVFGMCKLILHIRKYYNTQVIYVHTSVLYTVSVPHTSTWWFYSQCRAVFDNVVPMTWRLLGQEMMV